MKNRNRTKINGSKKAFRTTNAGTPSNTKEECCPCCLFLKGWLARRHNRSEDDLAAALLIYLLWTTRDAARLRAFAGFPSTRATWTSWEYAVPHETLQGLQVLAKAGLVAPYLCEGEPINPTEAHEYQRARRPVALAVDLLWLDEHQKCNPAPLSWSVVLPPLRTGYGTEPASPRIVHAALQPIPRLTT